MSAAIRIQAFGLKEVSDAINDTTSYLLSKKLVVESADIIVRDIKRNFRAGRSPLGRAWKPVRGKTHPLMGKNRRLYNSIMFRYVAKGESEIYSDEPHAGVHNYGGTIKARPGRALAVPLSPKFRNQSPRAFPEAFKKKFGTKMFIVRKGRGGQPFEFMYRLMRSVRIPRRPFLEVSNAAAQRVGDKIERTVELIWSDA